MSTSITYPHIIKSATEPARLERMPRLRVSQIVADYLAHGWSPEEMVRQHTGLTLAEGHSAMAYYFDHQQEIDSELHAELEQAENDRRTAPASKLLLRPRANGRL